MVAGIHTRPILPEMQFAEPRPLPAEMRLNWFQNVPAGVPFAYDQVTSLDYSLQLDLGMDRFHLANENIDQSRKEKFSPSRDPDDQSPSEILGIDRKSDGNIPIIAIGAAGLGGLAVGAIIAIAVLTMRNRRRSS